MRASSAAASSRVALRASSATSQPRRANSSAVARPTPALAPVTTTINGCPCQFEGVSETVVLSKAFDRTGIIDGIFAVIPGKSLGRGGEINQCDAEFRTFLAPQMRGRFNEGHLECRSNRSLEEMSSAS